MWRQLVPKGFLFTATRYLYEHVSGTRQEHNLLARRLHSQDRNWQTKHTLVRLENKPVQPEVRSLKELRLCRVSTDLTYVYLFNFKIHKWTSASGGNWEENKVCGKMSRIQKLEYGKIQCDVLSVSSCSNNLVFKTTNDVLLNTWINAFHFWALALSVLLLQWLADMIFVVQRDTGCLKVWSLSANLTDVW